MKSIYQLKSQFQTLLQPLLRLLTKSGISPNQLTMFTLLLCGAYALALALYPDQHVLWLSFPLLCVLRMALNALDGMLANYTNQKTKLGALLNEICDVAADLMLYLPFLFIANGPSQGGLQISILVFAMLNEVAGLAALGVGAKRGFAGPMGKSDRAFAYAILALLYAWSAPPWLINAWLVLMLLASLLTLRNRVAHALTQADR